MSTINVNNNGTLTPIAGMRITVDDLEEKMGDLNELVTTSDSSLVAAVNEIKARDLVHTVEDENGTTYANRSNMIFDNTFVITDDPSNDATVITSVVYQAKVGDVIDPSITQSGDTLTVKWSDPTDEELAPWAGTTLMRKVGSAPTSVNDGTVVVQNTTRNSYANTGYTDYNLTYGMTYYYRFFPYTMSGNVKAYTDGSAVNKTVERTVITTVPSQSGTLTYNGSTKTPSWSNYDSSQLQIGGTTSAVNAGNYTATFTPKTGYQWSGENPLEAKSVAWSIGKANGSVSLSTNSVSVTRDSPTTTVTVSNNTGTVSATSSNASIATVSVSGSTITITGVASGSATITVAVAASDNYNTNNSAGSISVTSSFKPVVKSWSIATDAELKEIVDAYYDGSLSLSDIKKIWSVGDERTVSLSAMSKTGVGESHVAQTQTFVIMNFGGKKLANDGTTDVLAIVGQKNMLANNGIREGGYMNSSNTNTGGWNACARRTWCNNIYKNAIPYGFRVLFKQFNNVTADGSGSTTVTSADYFALPSEKEVFGSTTRANATAEAGNTQFDYYKTAANRIKKKGDSGSADVWWDRSPNSGNANRFCIVGDDGSAKYTNAAIAYGISPFGCI